MYEVYELNTDETVATFFDIRLAVSLAEQLTSEYDEGGYQYLVRAI
jgi:hypothetical protein